MKRRDKWRPYTLRQIVQVVGAAVLFADDVFDMKGLVLVLVLVKLAGFASAAVRSQQRLGARRSLFTGEAASRCRAFDFKTAMKVA